MTWLPSSSKTPTPRRYPGVGSAFSTSPCVCRVHNSRQVVAVSSSQLAAKAFSDKGVSESARVRISATARSTDCTVLLLPDREVLISAPECSDTLDLSADGTSRRRWRVGTSIEGCRARSRIALSASIYLLGYRRPHNRVHLSRPDRAPATTSAAPTAWPEARARNAGRPLTGAAGGSRTVNGQFPRIERIRRRGHQGYTSDPLPCARGGRRKSPVSRSRAVPAPETCSVGTSRPAVDAAAEALAGSPAAAGHARPEGAGRP